MDISIFFDLKSKKSFGYIFRVTLKEIANQRRKNRFYADYGLSFLVRISEMCKSLQRKSQDQTFYLSGSILLYDICPTYLSGKFTRYRNLWTGFPAQTVSYGYSQAEFTKHVGECQSCTILEILGWFRTMTHRESPHPFLISIRRRLREILYL
jgi:hypothetical protein